MQKSIAISIEGPDAKAALGDLLAIEGIEGHAQEREPGKVMRSPELVAIGAIVGFGAGVAQIVSSIIDWRERWKKGNETKRLNVVIEDAKGNRLALDRATPEQITAVLQTLAD
jgi:hypothetical protein